MKTMAKLRKTKVCKVCGYHHTYVPVSDLKGWPAMGLGAHMYNCSCGTSLLVTVDPVKAEEKKAC